MTGMSLPTARTPEELSRFVVQQVAPDDLDVLAAVSAEFFGAPGARRRITRAVLGTRVRPPLTAIDPATASLLVQAVLVVLVGITMNVVATRVDQTSGKVGRFLRLRRARKTIAGPAGERAQTQPVPAFAPADLEPLLAETEKIIAHVGVPDEQRKEIVTILRYVLSAKAGPAQ